MRNAMIGGFMGVLLGCGVLMACGGGGTGSTQLVLNESLLAAAQIDAGPIQPVVNQTISNVGPPVTATRASTGWYRVEFGFNVSQRYVAVSPLRGNAGARIVNYRPGATPTSVDVFVFNANGTPLDQGGFYIMVF